MTADNKNAENIMFICGIIPVCWLGLMIAPYIDGGVPKIISNFAKITQSPFNITLCKNSIKAVLFLLLIYGLGIGIYLSNKKK